MHATDHVEIRVNNLSIRRRINFGYNRYWEGCTNMRLMSQRFADAVVQVIEPVRVPT